MLLQGKITLIVITVFLLSTLVCLGVQRLAIMPSFLELEQEMAIKNGERVLEAIHSELDQIGPSVSDWANWTDTYRYVKGENPDYTEDNLDLGTTLAGMKMNYLGIFDNSGTAFWTQAFDFEEIKIMGLGELTGDRLNNGNPLLQHLELTGEVKGLIDTPHGPLLVFAKPILTNDQLGPPAGTFIMGRFLDDRAISRIADQTKLKLDILPADKQTPSDWIGGVGMGLENNGIVLVEDSGAWQALSTLSDIYGRPYLQIQVTTQREISSRGAAAISASLWSLCVTGLFMMVMTLWLLQRSILRPISKLTEHALQICADDNLHTHLDIKSKDEVGILARSFDDMVDRFTEAKRQLEDQSNLSREQRWS